MASYFLQSLPENYTRNNRKNICKAITTLLTTQRVSVVPSFRTVRVCQQKFLLIGNCQLYKNFKRVYSAFLMKKLFRISETFLQISDERTQLKAEELVLFTKKGLMPLCHLLLGILSLRGLPVTLKEVTNSTPFYPHCSARNQEQSSSGMEKNVKLLQRMLLYYCMEYLNI